MNESNSDSGDRGFWPRIPFRFSLKTLLIGITVVAVLLGSGQSVLKTLVWPIVAAIAFPSLLMMALFGRGHRQAFAAGSLLTLVLGFFATNSISGAIAWLILAVLSGFVAMWMRLWIEKEGWNRSD